MAVLAIDLGASSGRGIVVDFLGDTMTYEEVHRFYNGAFRKADGLFWDVDELFKNIKIAIRNAVKIAKVQSLSIDTWGVDYAFVKKDGSICPAHSYRDERTSGIIDSFSYFTKDEMFSLSGISLNEFNTAYQLSTEKLTKEDYKEIDCFLFMPDLFSYMLTGEKGVEPTIASTSAFFDIDSFSAEFCKKIGLPASILPKVYKTGTVLGEIKDDIKKELGLDYDIKVVLGGGHDTACAVAAIPSIEEGNLFLSSGTWSLFGTELKEKVTSKEAFCQGFTNEIGVESIRFLKNITGLWLIQECKKEWEKTAPLSFGDIVEQCRKAAKKGAYINVADPVFTPPDNMPDRIVEYVKRTQNIQLEGVGEIADTIYRSLAMEYRFALSGLKKITNKSYKKLHIIGGGANNLYLNQLVADVLGLEVVAGPTEATAIGNALIQLIALGEVDDLMSARAVLKSITQLKYFYPQNHIPDTEYDRYVKLKN